MADIPAVTFATFTSQRTAARRTSPSGARYGGPNARANGISIEFTGSDVIGADGGWDVVLAGDVFYDRSFAERLIPWFTALHRRGAEILVGDPGRSYLPREKMQALAV